MDTTDDFPKNLKRLRKAAGLSQEILGGLVYLDKGTISRFERGIQQPRRSNLRALAEVLKCSINDFFQTESGRPGEVPPDIENEIPDEISLGTQLKVEKENSKRLRQMSNMFFEQLKETMDELKEVRNTLANPDLQTVWSRWPHVPERVRQFCLLALTRELKHLKTLDLSLEDTKLLGSLLEILYRGPTNRGPKT